MLSPGDDAISILCCVVNACGEGGRKKIAVLEMKRGIEVADIGRFFDDLQVNLDRNCKELQEAIEYMHARQKMFLATTKRKKN